MSDSLPEFAASASASREAWRKDVERSLKGRSFDAALIRPTIEGLPLQPLYTREMLPEARDAGAPGTGTFVRGLPAAGGSGGARRGWTRCVEVDHPDAARANGMLLADLQGGAERAIVRTVCARQALAASREALGRRVASGRGGTWIEDADDVRALLRDVMWGLAPVSLVAPADAACARRLFEVCALLRAEDGDGLGAQIDLMQLAWQAPDAAGWLRAYDEPVGAEVRRAAALVGIGNATRSAGVTSSARAEGTSSGTGADSMTGAVSTTEAASAAGVVSVADTARAWEARPLWIATTELRHAGADMVQEIAAAIGTFVAAVRTFDAQGLSAAAVLRATEFRLSAGSDFFGEIAKLRAFRQCLALVLDTLGITGHAGDALITVSTAEETLTRRDVHVNLLRTTAEATAAVLGGADGLVIHAFDMRLAGGTALGRRLARNLHGLIAEESDAGAVIDPGGGSFYIERRTAELAEAAWHQFVEWERAGGYVAASGAGLVRPSVEQRWQARAERLRTRRDVLLGVSVFPDLEEKRPAPASFDGEAFIERWRTRLGVDDADHADRAGDAGHAGSIDAAGPDEHYLDEEFEALRASADRMTARTGSPPVVFGALLGEPAAYAARLDWVRDLLATAGIRLDAQPVILETDGTPAVPTVSAVPGEHTVHAVHAAYVVPTVAGARGALSAIVISPDALHGSTAPAVIAALRQAGFAEVAVAGRPGEHEAALREAGASSFIFAGADIVSFLTRLLHRAETPHVRS